MTLSYKFSIYWYTDKVSKNREMDYLYIYMLGKKKKHKFAICPYN